LAGYSATPLARKLGMQSGHRVALVDAPEGFEAILEALPPDVVPERFDIDGAGEGTRSRRAPRHGARAHDLFDVIVWFNRSAQALEDHFGAWAEQLIPNGGLWIAWPKRASKVPTDLDEQTIRTIGLAAGLVDNKVCAVDETWSGLRFVYRLADRPQPRRTHD